MSTLREGSQAITSPAVIPRASHDISRANISENALKVLYRLRNAGFESYLVGGCVRDLLLGREPKDFDVVTDARPEQVKELFRNCRLIGRRFRLAHVHFGPEIVEVATFRGRSEDTPEARDDNVYGTLEEDSWRRDFTVNALYYNIRDFSVVDFTGGMQDLESGTIRVIGDPDRSYREDPVRILRAVRFAAKLGFRIDPATEAPIGECACLLEEVPPARLFEEVLKLFMGGYALETFELLRRHDVFRHLFPETDACLAEEDEGFPQLLVAKALANTDTRVDEGKPVTPAFLFGALLWPAVHALARAYREQGLRELPALERAAREVIARQQHHVALPRRFAVVAQEIWGFQPRFTRRRGRQPLQLLAHPRFRAAYDFLLLRAEAGEEVDELARWWTEFQEADEAGRHALLEDAPRRKRRRKRRRPRRALAKTEHSMG